MISGFFSESKKIVVIGNYGKGNIGDETMLIVLSEMLNTHGIREIYVPSINPPLVKKLCNNLVEPVSMNIAPVKMIQSDTIIVGGGTLFSQQAGVFIKLSLVLCLILKLFNKKLFFIGFGVSKDTPILLKPILKLSLSLADGIALRDTLSDVYLRQWGITKSILIPDLAYGINLPNNANEYFFPELDFNTTNVGVVLSSSIDESSYQKILQTFPSMFDNLISEMNRDINILFIMFSPGFSGMKSDEVLNFKIIDKMKNHDLVHILPYYPPLKIISLFIKLDLIIGMRYHSKIFSHITDTPLIGIKVHDKDIAFHRETRFLDFELNDLLETDDARKGFNKCVMSLLKAN